MRSRKLGLYSCIVFILMCIAGYLAVSKNDFKEEEYEEEKAALSGAGKNLNSWWWSRAFPNATGVNEKYMAAWNKMQEIKRNTPAKYKNPAITGISGVNGITSDGWNALGPATLGGRILCLAIHPVNRKVLFAGSASGGIWKSTTGGVGLNAWQKVETGLPTLGVTSILIDPVNPNVMYAATGEIYRTDVEAMGFNVWKTRGTYGIGILKSIDGGDNWTQVFTKNTSELFGVQKLRFDPTNSSTIYAACTDGLYRSTNSGAVWSRILEKVYVSDVQINPLDTKQIIAAVGNVTNTDKGIYRTINGNNALPDWNKITSGLPTSYPGSIYFTECHVNNTTVTVYASIGRGGNANNSINELFRSTDFGVGWSTITNSYHGDFQHWFAHAVAFDPNNINRVFIAGVKKHRLIISGTTGTRANIATGSSIMDTYIDPGGQEGTSTYVHDDVHNIVFVPNRSDSVYFCTDGGIFLSVNANVNTASNMTFQSCNSGLQTAQFFGPVAQSQTDANFFLGGLQDNNTAVYDGITKRWKRVIGGDGGPTAIKPDDNNIVLSSRDARAVYKSTNKTGSYSQVTNYWGFAADSRTGFMAPLAFSKSNSNIVYLASDNLHRSTNAGTSFTGNDHATATNYIDQKNKTAVALAVSPTNENKVYISTSPFAQKDNDDDGILINGNPNLRRTINANNTTPTYTSIMAGLPNRFVMDIAIHPINDNTLWVTMGGYGSSHVFKSTDGGSSWMDIDRGMLPDAPTNAIMLDPNNPNILYVGNDLGVFVSPDGGVNWMDYGGGLWDATLVMDLVPVPGGKIRAATHGKGIYERTLFNPAILPVTLIWFKGIEQATNNVLQWKVSHEINLKHYVVERSADGINFQQVGIVKSKNIDEEITYQYTDVNISNSFYYRIKSVDRDGKYQHTHVIQLKRNIQSEMRVLGNPFYSEVQVIFQLATGGKLQVNLYDSKGALVSKETIAANAGATNHKISGLGRLPKGIYQVEAIIDNQRWVQKLMKR